MTDDSEESGAEAFVPDSGPGKNEMTESWLPDSDDWLPKTFFDRGDAAALAAVKTTIEVNPETDLDEIFEDTLTEYFRALVSENGRGFSAYQRAIESMHGNNPDDADKESMAVRLVADEKD